MSESEVQDLINAILNTPEPAQPEVIHTRDGQIAGQMRQQALLQLIQHPQLKMRQQAAELLGESLQPSALQALLKLASDPESEVRQQAITSLGNFEDDSSVQALIIALDDTDYLIRATAAELLGSRKTATVLEPLMKCLKDRDAMVRATAAEALGRQEAFLAAPALRDLLLDQDQWVRYSAAESLSQIEPDEAIWPQIMNANSADLPTRQAAIQALGELADRRAIPWMLMMLNDDSELEETVLSSLESFHDPLAVPALVELALFTQKPHLREQALIQAQQLSMETTISSLTSWLDPERPQYAQPAIEALHELPTESIMPVLFYALQHPDPWVCTVAMLTIEERRLAAPPEQLLPFLEDSLQDQETLSPDLIKAAFKNLVRYHPEAAHNVIRRFADSAAAWQRLILAENIGHLYAPEALSLAQQLQQDPESEIREAALRSVGSLKNAQIFELLLKGSQDPDAWVRQAAIESLGQHPDPEAQNRLLELLAADEDFLVRAAAAEALATRPADNQQLYQGLVEALNDSKPSVRLQVVHALFAQERPPEQEILERLIKDPDKSVVLATLQQLRHQPALAQQAGLEALLSSEDLQIRSAAAALQTS